MVVCLFFFCFVYLHLILLWIYSLIFLYILHEVREPLGAQKWQPDFLGKFIFFLKWLKWTQNGQKIGFSRNVVVTFFGSNLNWMILWFFVSLCKHNIWGNSSVQVIGQNTLFQSDCMKETVTLVMVWPGVPSHAQTCLDLTGCLSVVWGVMVRLQIVYNEGLIISIKTKLFFFTWYMEF